MFALNTEPVDYICRDNSSVLNRDCTAEYICEQKMLNNSDFSYSVNTEKDGYLKNWYETRDLMCMPKVKINKIVSFNFLGFAIGVVFFFFPD